MLYDSTRLCVTVFTTGSIERNQKLLIFTVFKTYYCLKNETQQTRLKTCFGTIALIQATVTRTNDIIHVCKIGHL